MKRKPSRFRRDLRKRGDEFTRLFVAEVEAWYSYGEKLDRMAGEVFPDLTAQLALLDIPMGRRIFQHHGEAE